MAGCVTVTSKPKPKNTRRKTVTCELVSRTNQARYVPGRLNYLFWIMNRRYSFSVPPSLLTSIIPRFCPGEACISCIVLPHLIIWHPDTQQTWGTMAASRRIMDSQVSWLLHNRVRRVLNPVVRTSNAEWILQFHMDQIT